MVDYDKPKINLLYNKHKMKNQVIQNSVRIVLVLFFLYLITIYKYMSAIYIKTTLGSERNFQNELKYSIIKMLHVLINIFRKWKIFDSRTKPGYD